MRCDVHDNGTGENVSARKTVHYGSIEPDVSTDPGSAAVVTMAPVSNSLYQNYPNPFNPSTQIWFGLSKPAHVRLVVYDMLGREISRLADEDMDAGYHSVSWDAGNVSSGVYI